MKSKQSKIRKQIKQVELKIKRIEAQIKNNERKELHAEDHRNEALAAIEHRGDIADRKAICKERKLTDKIFALWDAEHKLEEQLNDELHPPRKKK